MTTARGPLATAGWFAIALLVACHRPPARQAPPVSTVSAFFRDTALVTVNRFDARDLDVRVPAQRDSLHAILQREREQWRALAPKDYRFLLNVSCFCPGPRGWLLMEVRSGQPLKAWDRTGKPVPPTDWSTLSVDGLFDNIERSLERDVSVRTLFDPQWHFPAFVSTSYRPGPDAWAIYEARGFKPI